MARGGKSGPQQGPSPAVVQALKEYEKQRSDAALQGVLRLVEERAHGSAACMGAVKALLLHAAQASERPGPDGEAAVADLLLQATEAAVHGALRYRSIQLLEASCHLFSTTSGNKHHSDRRPAILSLLREAGDLIGWRLDKVEASPLLPVEQLMADSDLPRSSSWWNNVPFADWVHPAAEAVGSSMCAWECPRPYANLGEYQEAVRKNASSSTHNALVSETLGKIHLQPPENMSKRNAMLRKLHQQVEQDTRMSQPLQERLARSILLPKVVSAELRKKLGIRTEADREMTLQVAKAAADKGQRRREQPTIEDRKRTLKKKLREDREARELDDAHRGAKVVADFLRLHLERSGSEGSSEAAADPLAVVCQVVRMPWKQLVQQLSQMPGANREQEPGYGGEETSAKEREMFELFEQIKVLTDEFDHSRQRADQPLVLYRSPYKYSGRYSPEPAYHLGYLATLVLPTKSEEMMSGLHSMDGMRGVVEASEQLRRAANELLPRLGTLFALSPDDDLGLFDDEEPRRPSGRDSVLEALKITEPRTHVPDRNIEQVPVLAHPSIPHAALLPPLPITADDLRELCGLPPLPDPAPSTAPQQGQQATAAAALPPSDASVDERQRQHGSSTPDVCDEAGASADLGFGAVRQRLEQQQQQWEWAADLAAEDEEDILQALGMGAQQQEHQQQPAAAEAAGSQNQQPQAVPGRRRLLTRRLNGSPSSSAGAGASRGSSGLVVEEFEDADSDADTASIASEGSAVASTSSGSGGAQLDRSGGLGRASSSSSGSSSSSSSSGFLSGNEAWLSERRGRGRGRGRDVHSSDATRSRSTSLYGSSPEQEGSPRTWQHLSAAARRKAMAENAVEDLNRFLLRQTETRRVLRGLFCAHHYLADAPAPVPENYKAPALQLAHIALDRSLRPTLLGTWLLRYLEEGEAGVQQHTVNIHALSAAEILEVHGSEALPRLAAMWGSTQLLTELVQQEETADVAQRMEAVMKEQLSSLMRRKELQAKLSTDSEALDEVRVSVQLEYSARLVRAMLCAGDELRTAAQASLEREHAATPEEAAVVAKLGTAAFAYKQQLARFVLRGLRLLRETHRLTRPLWSAVVQYLFMLRDPQAELEYLRQEEQEAAHEARHWCLEFRQLLQFSDEEWRVANGLANGHLKVDASDPRRQTAEDLLSAYMECLNTSTEGKAWVAADERRTAATTRLHALTSGADWWEVRSNNSEHLDDVSWSTNAVDTGAEPWLLALAGMPVCPLELLHAFVATQVALSFSHLSDISPSLKGSLAKIEALAVLQMYVQPERSGEGQQPKEECEIVLRAEGLAKALGPEAAEGTDQMVASFANLAAGLRPADTNQGTAAGAAAGAAAAAPAEQAGSVAGRSEGRSKRAGPGRASSGALPDASAASGRSAAGDAAVGSLVLDGQAEQQDLMYSQAMWAAQKLMVLMLAAGGLAHIVQRLTDIHDAAFDSELLDEEVCRGLAKLGTTDHRTIDRIAKTGAAMLQLRCLVDHSTELCAAFSKALELGATQRLYQGLEMAQQQLTNGLPVYPLELDSSRTPSLDELEDRLLECREEAKDAKAELDEMLRSCGLDMWAWLRSSEQRQLAAAAQPLVNLRETTGDNIYKLWRLQPADKVRMSKEAARSMLEVMSASKCNFACCSANDEAGTLLVLEAECYSAALRLLSATWSCYGGAVLPLDGAARAMLRYVLPPVWKKELDEVEEKRRGAAQAALMEEEDERKAAAEAAAAKRKAKKKKGKKAAAAGADEEQAAAAAEAEEAAEAQPDEGEEQAAEDSLEDMALLLGRKQQAPPAQQQPTQQSAAAQPAAPAAPAQQQQEGRRRKGRNRGGGGAAAAAAEEEQQLPEGYLRMLAEMQANEQAAQAAAQQRQQQQQQDDELTPELLQMLAAMDVNEAAQRQPAQPPAQQQVQQPPPPPPPAMTTPVGQVQPPLPLAPAQQPHTPPQPPQLGVTGVQASVSEPDHSLEAQLAAASAFDWTSIEGAEAEASWLSSSSSAAPAAADWHDAAATSHKPRQPAAAGAAQQQPAPPAAPAAPAALPARRSVDRSKPRVVDWDGKWICKCGRERNVRDGCKPCGYAPPCRDYLKGQCPFRDTCNFPHLQLDLPAEGPPPGSKPLVVLPKPAAAHKPQHDERMARVVSWRGEYICPCGTRRFMQHACKDCGYGPVCRDWVRGRCEFGASCRFSHPLFDLAKAPSVPLEERVVLGRLSDLPQWRPPAAASSAAARLASRPSSAPTATQRPQSGSAPQPALLAASPAAVAAVCAQFGMGLEELEAMLGPDGLQDALEQVQLQEAERASLQASSSAAAAASAPAAAGAAPPPPPPRPVSAAPVSAAAQQAEALHAPRAASQASSGSLPADSSSVGGVRIVSSDGSWVCQCGARNHSKRARCSAEGCSQLAPCRKWMLGACTAERCNFPHPPFDPAGDWRPPKDGKPKAVLWEGAPLFGAPHPAAAIPQPAAAAPQPAIAALKEAAAEEEGDLDELLQNLGIGDSSAGGWGDVGQGGSIAPAAADSLPALAPDSLSAFATPGLRNEAGEYNCFLNAIIQCLWRCADFRQQLAAWGPGVCGRDRVVSALYSLFAAFAAEEQQRQQAGPLQGTTTRRGLVNPSELRQALSALPGPQQYRVGEMNDAGEVLLTIYERVMEVSGQDDGPVQRIFGLPVAEHVQCHSCSRVTQQNSYTQFYQNITAASLQSARGSYLQAESMLMFMRLVEQQHMKTCDLDVGGCGLKNSVRHKLLRPPRVFTLQLGWQSQQEEPHSIAATLAAVDEMVNLADFYEGVPPGTPHYALHSMVCYYGAHYSAFVWAADCRAWLLFDDVRVSRVGSWTDVRRKCEAGRIQPSVLFYEAVA